MLPKVTQKVETPFFASEYCSKFKNENVYFYLYYESLNNMHFKLSTAALLLLLQPLSLSVVHILLLLYNDALFICTCLLFLCLLSSHKKGGFFFIIFHYAQLCKGKQLRPQKSAAHSFEYYYVIYYQFIFKIVNKCNAIVL